MVWNKHDLSFEQHYTQAEKYFREHGDLLVPANYVTTEGLGLGRWIRSMRAARKGVSRAVIDDERIRRLDAIGMHWNVSEDRWEQGYNEAERHYRANKDMKMSPQTKTETGFPLGQWLQVLFRNDKKRGEERRRGRGSA